MQVNFVNVRITISDPVRADTTILWTIRNLPPGGSAVRGVAALSNVPAATGGPEKVPQRLYAEITESDPEEAPRFLSNNATEDWVVENRHGGNFNNGVALYTNGDAAVGTIGISDPNPQPGGATTFRIPVNNPLTTALLPGIDSDEQDNTLFEVQFKISLSPGLSFAGTQPDPWEGTTFDTATGIWNVGTMGEHRVQAPLSLQVAVNLTAHSLADLPLEERCLTAKVVSQVPWFASDPSKRVNDTATACLGKAVLAEGERVLLDYIDCVGVTSNPCTSADTLELVVEWSDDVYRQPETVIVQVQDPQGRDNGKWRTGKTRYHATGVPNTPGVQVIVSYLPRTYSQYHEAVSDVSPKQRPGTFTIFAGNLGTYKLLDADTTTSTTPFNLSATTTNNPYPIILEFGALGTYKLNLTVGATHSTAGALTDTGTYTFHVGPMADLKVRDAGANPEVAVGRSAYTVMAVNKGPDTAPAVQVTLTGAPEGAEAIPSQGRYDERDCQNGLCEGVWTVGYLAPGYAHRAFSGIDGEGAALTLITATGDPITAAIENTQDYCVRTKTSDRSPGNDLECAEGSVPAGYTEHSVPYYDHVEGNNTATIAAHAGSGLGLSAPKGVKVMETPVANILTWQPVEKLYGYVVSHYEVQRSASPWMTLALDVAATKNPIYLDYAPGDNPDYRVRAMNELGIPGQWSQQATSLLEPGRPKSFTAAGQSDTVAGLSWGAPDTVDGVTVTGYDLEFSKDRGATWTSLAAPATLGQGATSYTHTEATLTAASLTPDILRQYRLRTVGTVESTTVKSDWATAILTHPKPGVPVDFAAAGESETQAELSWSAPAAVTHVNVTGYELEFSKDGGVSWTRLMGTPTLDGTDWTLTHTNSNLAADAVRQYRARAVGTVGSVTVESDYAYALATENYPAPGAPRDFAATAASDTMVTLTWNAPEAVADVNLTGYELEVSIDRGVTWTSVATASALGSGATTHTHTDAANPLSSKPRQYRLKAVGTVGGSTYESGWVFAVPAEAVGPPQNLTATPDGRNRIDLAWGQPGFGAEAVTGYRIDHAPAAAEDWRTLEHGYRTSPRRYEHTGLLPGERHCYRVAATYAGGTGPFTARACATTEAVPAGSLPGEPENLRVAQVGSNYVTLEWDPPSVGGPVEYYEYRSNIHRPVEVSPKTATSVTVRGLSATSTYNFHVRAGNSYGPGVWSQPIHVALNQAGSVVKASPAELEVDKGGSGSFNVSLNRSPQWPLALYFVWEGPDCLTESLLYQQGKILLPTNPPPSKEFWEDFWWGPPEDRFARLWNAGLDIWVDASGCQGGETAVVNYDVWSLPFSYLEGLSLWDHLGLNLEEWRVKWGVDPLNGVSGSSVKVTVSDSGTQ